jgi:hypothetical protein
MGGRGLIRVRAGSLQVESVDIQMLGPSRTPTISLPLGVESTMTGI